MVLEIEQTRPGIFGGLGGCEERSNIIEQTIICSETYADVEAFFCRRKRRSYFRTKWNINPSKYRK